MWHQKYQQQVRQKELLRPTMFNRWHPQLVCRKKENYVRTSLVLLVAQKFLHTMSKHKIHHRFYPPLLMNICSIHATQKFGKINKSNSNIQHSFASKGLSLNCVNQFVFLILKSPILNYFPVYRKHFEFQHRTGKTYD